ncbi:MAG: hypothetical protein HXX20_21290 [Chloroflexi bacterium]|nr:hypothetical protein [Chloroflexota bacterium]
MKINRLSGIPQDTGKKINRLSGIPQDTGRKINRLSGIPQDTGLLSISGYGIILNYHALERPPGILDAA